MPDITQPETVQVVERRLEGRSQGGSKSPAEQPAKKVVATYEEAAKTQPADDRITILGIPVEQITPATQAALGGLVAEINYLRGLVKRHEKTSGRQKGDHRSGSVLEPESFLRALGTSLAQAPPLGGRWVLVLVHVPTAEDIRRSSGLLAANGVLGDVASRLKDFRLDLGTSGAVEPTPTVASMATALPLTFTVVGYAGGFNLAGLTALPPDHDQDALAHAVRGHLTASAYTVGGLDMAVAVKVAAAVIGEGESATLALGRADHLLRVS